MIDDLAGVLRSTYLADDFGMDAVSCGKVIGFSMEAYDKRLIDRRFLDGIDLTWGNVDAVHQMIETIAHRDGIGDQAARGVKHLAKRSARRATNSPFIRRGRRSPPGTVTRSPTGPLVTPPRTAVRAT